RTTPFTAAPPFGGTTSPFLHAATARASAKTTAIGRARIQPFFPRVKSTRAVSPPARSASALAFGHRLLETHVRARHRPAGTFSIFQRPVPSSTIANHGVGAT